jgi:hypothetical protein
VDATGADHDNRPELGVPDAPGDELRAGSDHRLDQDRDGYGRLQCGDRCSQLRFVGDVQSHPPTSVLWTAPRVSFATTG